MGPPMPLKKTNKIKLIKIKTPKVKVFLCFLLKQIVKEVLFLQVDII